MGNETSVLPAENYDDYTPVYNDGAACLSPPCPPGLVLLPQQLLNNETNMTAGYDALKMAQNIFENSLPNLPLLIGFVICFAVLVMLGISLLCHHVQDHITMLKELERAGYKPDHEWRKSLIYRLSVWVRHRNERIKFSPNKAHLQAQSDEANSRRLSISENGHSDINRQSSLSGSASGSLRRSPSISENLKELINSNADGTSETGSKSPHSPNNKRASEQSQLRRFFLPISSESTKHDGSPEQYRPLSALNDFVLRTITPTLILTSIAEEHEHNSFNPDLLVMPVISAARHAASVSGDSSKLNVYDSELLRRVLTLDLIEMHQRLRVINEEIGNIGKKAPTLASGDNSPALTEADDESLNRDSFATSTDDLKTINDLPIDLLSPGSDQAFLEDEDEDSDSPFFPSNSAENVNSSQQLERISLSQLPDTPQSLPVPEVSKSASRPRPRSSPISSRYLMPPPPTVTFGSSINTRRLPQSGAHSKQQQQHDRPAGTITTIKANKILTQYAKRIGDAYCTDFF